MKRAEMVEKMRSFPFDKVEGTVCGTGSTLKRTEKLRNWIPSLLEKYGPIVNDAGCGDFHWMKEVNLRGVDYHGYDVVEYPTWDDRFSVLDITAEKMRPCGLIICRDVLIHIPKALVIEALKLFRESGIYLLAPSYTDNENNAPDGFNNKIDLAKPPFNLGEPRWMMDDEENGESRYMGLWKL